MDDQTQKQSVDETTQTTSGEDPSATLGVTPAAAAIEENAPIEAPDATANDEENAQPVDETTRPEDRPVAESAQVAEENAPTEGAQAVVEVAPTEEKIAAPKRCVRPPVPETESERKKLAYTYLIYAAIGFACLYVVQFFHVFDGLFDRIYYGNLTTIFYYILNVFFWIPAIILLHRHCARHTDFKPVRRAYGELSLKRSLVLYACTVVPIFIVSAALGFTVKIVYELGKRVTGMQLISNASMYAHGAVKLILALMILEWIQEAIDLLYRGKFAGKIPWGGIALAVTFGLAEILVAALSGGSMLFACIYLAFDLWYGVIYLLADRNFPAYYFVCLILYIL